MKPRLLELLACPLDRTALDLHPWEVHGDEIATGLLLNRTRRIAYPIHEGVPRMLTFATGVARVFEERHQERMARELPGFTLPRHEAMPGEGDVLRTFSTEWTEYDWNGQAYWNLTPETWFACMRFMLDLEKKPIRGKRVLEVGIGIGGVADYNASIEGAEVVGMDLGHSVDGAYRHFGNNPALHIVQGSLFAPPFPASAFDLVYSFGVIHHTFSTQAAFAKLADLPRPGGRLNVWVYSPYNEQRTLSRRILMGMEQVIRPIAWRLPDRAQAAVLLPLIPLYMGFQGLRSLKGQVRYGWREAMHAARDRFTPRYVHRHSDDEVASWFRSAGYEAIQCASQKHRPDWVPVTFTACTGVDGVRRPTWPW